MTQIQNFKKNIKMTCRWHRTKIRKIQNYKMRKNTKVQKNQNSKLYRRHSTKLQKLQKQNYSSWGRLTLWYSWWEIIQTNSTTGCRRLKYQHRLNVVHTIRSKLCLSDWKDFITRGLFSGVGEWCIQWRHPWVLRHGSILPSNCSARLGFLSRINHFWLIRMTWAMFLFRTI